LWQRWREAWIKNGTQPLSKLVSAETHLKPRYSGTVNSNVRLVSATGYHTKSKRPHG